MTITERLTEQPETVIEVLQYWLMLKENGIAVNTRDEIISLILDELASVLTTYEKDEVLPCNALTNIHKLRIIAQLLESPATTK